MYIQLLKTVKRHRIFYYRTDSKLRNITTHARPIEILHGVESQPAAPGYISSGESLQASLIHYHTVEITILKMELQFEAYLVERGINRKKYEAASIGEQGTIVAAYEKSRPAAATATAGNS